MSVPSGSERGRPVAITSVPAGPRRRSWLGVLESWHGAQRRLIPVTMDAAVAGALTAWVTGSTRTGLLAAAVLISAGLVFGLFKPRVILETQGVAWYPLRFLPVATSILLVLDTGVDGTTTGQAWRAALAVLVMLTAVRALLWLIISAARRRGKGLRRTLVIGPAERVEQMVHRLRTYREAGLVHAGSFVPTGPEGHGPSDGRALVERLLAVHRVEQVLCVVDSINEAVFRDLVRFAGNRVDCAMVLPVPGIAVHQTKAHLGDLAVIPIRTSPSSGSSMAKRVFDVVVASVVLFLISPMLASVALAIRIDDPGPAIFRQRRVGRNGRSFTVYKFRSMIVDAEARRHEHLTSNINTEGLLFKLENDPRITPVGAVIRRFSIDELPQLVNVIKGDMSLVGPRPLPVDPDEFDVSAQIRHKVSPGITGLWQVHGANALRYADMVDLDLTYVTTRSMGLDLVLLARTLPAVVFRRAKAY
ncbi:MAG: exopolysaccharide biosynthesis polyprenyl glycosylphosphotransferase [Actinomycetota bacterium]|nr:exopolysaccharide biosynthesis polyprenyl glycosylphosphotransferase [Actinomycetota bacterium]